MKLYLYSYGYNVLGLDFYVNPTFGYLAIDTVGDIGYSNRIQPTAKKL